MFSPERIILSMAAISRTFCQHMIKDVAVPMQGSMAARIRDAAIELAACFEYRSSYAVAESRIAGALRIGI
jgi:hypothetical protein